MADTDMKLSDRSSPSLPHAVVPIAYTRWQQLTHEGVKLNGSAATLVLGKQLTSVTTT